MTSTRGACRAAASVGAAFAAVCTLACATQVDALARGQRYYEDNQYERALALWRDLDRRGAEFSPAEHARYAYFRGMTDYRLGYRDEARHWLAVASARDAAHPGALGAVWLERLDNALADLARAASRPGAGGPDAVQTIVAPPGTLLPDDVDEDPASTPPAAEPPASEPGSSDPPASEPGSSEPPASEPGSSEPESLPPATLPPASTPPASTPPASTPPASTPPASERPAVETGVSTEP